MDITVVCIIIISSRSLLSFLQKAKHVCKRIYVQLGVYFANHVFATLIIHGIIIMIKIISVIFPSSPNSSSNQSSAPRVRGSIPALGLGLHWQPWQQVNIVIDSVMMVIVMMMIVIVIVIVLIMMVIVMMPEVLMFDMATGKPGCPTSSSTTLSPSAPSSAWRWQQIFSFEKVWQQIFSFKKRLS